MSSTVFYDSANKYATISASFVNSAGVATDPTAISCVVTDPAGGQVTHTYQGTPPADITRTGTGSYQLAVKCSPSVAGADGLWSFTFIGTGAVTDVQPGTWRVLPLNIGTWYVGLEELKDRLGIENDGSADFTSDDSSIQRAIQAASAWVNEYCVVPETPVLTADLRWVPAGRLGIGDDIVGVDEYPVGNRFPKRCYRRAQVTAAPRRRAACTRIVLEDGREVITAADHRWLARSNHGKNGRVYGWTHACLIQPGYEISAPLTPWPEESSFEAGWMSGLLDGEGWLHNARTDGSPRNGKGAHVGVAQNPGLVLSRAERYLKETGIPYAFNNGFNRCRVIEIYTRKASMEILGRLQPCRLMPGSAAVWEGGQVTGSARVVSVEHAGVREVVSLGTSTGTYIADGLVSHNCGRHFYQVTETRTYMPHDIWLLKTDDIISVTSVFVDQDGDGVFETPMTQNVDYQLRLGDDLYNVNAAGVPRPYTQLQIIQTGKWFPFTWPYTHLDRVQITGTWGWPVVPPPVTEATMTLAADWFKLKDAPFGVAGMADYGAIKVQPNPWMIEQLKPYVKPRRKVGV